MKKRKGSFYSLLRKINIRVRLYSIHILIAFATLISVAFVLRSLAQTAIVDNTDAYLNNYLSQLRVNIDYILMQTDTIFQNLVTDASLHESVTDLGKEQPEHHAKSTSNIRQEMHVLSQSINRFIGAEIYSLTERLASLQTRITTGDINTSPILQTINASPTKTVFLGTKNFESGMTNLANKYVIIGGKIQSRSASEPAGFAVAAFSEMVFHQVLYNSSVRDNSVVYITDYDGTIVSHLDKTLLGTPENPEITKKILAQENHEEKSFLVDIDGHPYFIHYNYCSTTNWRITAITDYQMLMSQLNSSFNKALFPIVALIFLTMLLSLAASKSIIRPIYEIVDVIKSTSIDSRYPMVEVDGKDEIAYLGNVINEMSERIQLLLNKTKDAMEKEHTAQMQALQAQINPHFLYNTLDTVNWMAYLADNYEVCDIISDLSNFFRSSLSIYSENYTIENELTHLKYYCSIQQKRFYQHVHVKYDVDPACLHFRILKIVLQPLVENAIIHGLSPNDYNGTIEVQVSKKNEIIELSVMDDGVGLAAAAAHPNSMKNSSGYGLSNIDKRIKLAYGEDYGLSIEERFPHGTIATIRIPAILEGNTSDQHSDN